MQQGQTAAGGAGSSSAVWFCGFGAWTDSKSLVGLRSWLGNPWGTLSYLASLEGEEQPSVVHLVCPESPQPGRGLVCAEVLHHSV